VSHVRVVFIFIGSVQFGTRNKYKDCHYSSLLQRITQFVYIPNLILIMSYINLFQLLGISNTEHSRKFLLWYVPCNGRTITELLVGQDVAGSDRALLSQEGM
jgi:hypothetical protein